MTRLVFAKKCVLPTTGANVLQSLHMAAAFRLAGAATRFFPGVKGKNAAARLARLHAALSDLGAVPEAAKTWEPLPGNHAGLYGLRFRTALAASWFAGSDAVFYARDVQEAGFLVRLSSFSRKKRLVFEMHEALHEQPHNANQRDRLLRLERRIMAGIDGLVVINPALAEKACASLGYKGPILVEPSGFSADIFKPLPLFTPENPWPGPGEIVQLIYCGRFHPGKGVENLVAAMGHLPANVHLRVIGDSPAPRLAALRDIAASIPGSTERIRFAGAVPQKDVPTACAGGHIFVVPQENDASYFSPLKLQEAMALGLPVLATPLAAFDAEKKAGLVASTPGTSPQDLAEGVLALSADPGRAAALREAALAASRARTWEARAGRILAFCNGLGAHSGPRACAHPAGCA